jgi:hypothetical protein
MGLFDLFKRKPKINSVEEFYRSHLPQYDEVLLFLSMIKGKRLNHVFYGNTECVQANKREALKTELYKAVENGLFQITTGDYSIAETLSKKELVEACKNLNVPISGNKIDLVCRIKNINPNYFNKHIIDDWILVTKNGREVLKQYQDKFDKEYNNLVQTVYNLLLNNKQNEALKLFDMFRMSYPFKRNGDGFFISFSIDELKKIISEIRSTNVFDKIGFPKIYGNAFKTVLCVSYLFGGVDLHAKFEEIMEGSVDFLKRSNLIKNKDLPFVDLNNLIRGYQVRKHPL